MATAEVGRFPALCGAVTQEDEGLARLGSLGTRPASHPDRRSACRRPCLGGGDRRRWQRRQACPGRGRGGDGEHGRRPGLARQSPRQGARSDTAGLFAMARHESPATTVLSSGARSATPSVWPPTALPATGRTPCICGVKKAAAWRTAIRLSSASACRTNSALARLQAGKRDRAPELMRGLSPSLRGA